MPNMLLCSWVAIRIIKNKATLIQVCTYVIALRNNDVFDCDLGNMFFVAIHHYYMDVDEA
jgi:hypothetical protein